MSTLSFLSTTLCIFLRIIVFGIQSYAFSGIIHVVIGINYLVAL